MFLVCRDKLENDFVHSANVLAGKKTTCRILRWNNGGAIVQFGSGLNGFIPNQLFHSKKLTAEAKEKLIGSTRKARIMQRDPETDKITLTVRKELVRSEGAVIASLEEAEPGMVGHGIVKFCTKVAAFVETIGNVLGFIPSRKLTKIPLKDVREAFRKGQIVQYKVLERIEGRDQLLMTAILDSEEEFDQDIAKKEKVAKKQNNVIQGAEAASKNRKRKLKNKKKKEQSDNSSEMETEEMNGSEEKEVTNHLSLPESGSFWDTATPTIKTENESDSDEEDDTRPQKMRKVT